MKNIQNRINTKLFTQEEKVELSEVVELGVTQDAEKAISKYYSSTDKALNKGQDAFKMLNEAVTEFEKMLKTADDLESYKSRLEKAAKDLGVPTSGWRIIEDLEIAIKNAKELTQYKNTLQKAVSIL